MVVHPINPATNHHHHLLLLLLLLRTILYFLLLRTILFLLLPSAAQQWHLHSHRRPLLLPHPAQLRLHHHIRKFLHRPLIITAAGDALVVTIHHIHPIADARDALLTMTIHHTDIDNKNKVERELQQVLKSLSDY
ncbi:hypothetical protein AAG906_025205 [Vitis piasezkii]